MFPMFTEFVVWSARLSLVRVSSILVNQWKYNLFYTTNAVELWGVRVKIEGIWSRCVHHTAHHSTSNNKYSKYTRSWLLDSNISQMILCVQTSSGKQCKLCICHKLGSEWWWMSIFLMKTFCSLDWFR